MADKVLFVEPTTLDSLSWSETSDLAVAAGEHVELLIPKLKAGLDSLDQFWETVHLRVNEFREHEAPTAEPASFRTLSIGEELSTSEVIHLAWSPQGLARHTRCALAVLTQNLALSVWTPGADPRMHHGWNRSLVVNRELDEFFALREPEPAGGPELKAWKDWSERLTRFQRVRAFTWSPAAHLGASRIRHSYSPSEAWGKHFLAVANDENKIVILSLSSAGSNAAVGGPELTAEAIAQFSVVVGQNVPLPDLTWTFEDYLQNQHYATRVSWSPWVRWTDGSLLAIIAYATRSKMGFRQVNVFMSPNGPVVRVGDQEADIAFEIPGAANGPMRWLPKACKDMRIQLFASSGSTIIRYDLAAVGNIDIKRSCYVCKEWDPISGLALTDAQGGSSQLHFSPHTSVKRTGSPTTLDTTSLKPEQIGVDSNWRKIMLRHKDVFGAEKGMDENVEVIIWGMASSPTGHLIATNFSLHPSNMPEYSIPSDDRSIVSISRACDDLDKDMFTKSGSREIISAEAVAFTLKAWIAEQTFEEQTATIQELISAIESASAAEIEFDASEASPIKNVREIFHTTAMKNARLKRIISLFSPEHAPHNVLDPSEENDEVARIDPLDDSSMVRLLSVAMINISNLFVASSDAKSKEIMHSYLMASMFRMQGAEDTETFGEGEKCEICQSRIPFDSLVAAKCMGGHQSDRCALTFLAIQAPGISKFCGICGKRYLSESYLADLEQPQPVEAGDNEAEGEDRDIEMEHGKTSESKLDQKERQPSLAQALFAACDVCIYCGGKFVDKT